MKNIKLNVIKRIATSIIICASIYVFTSCDESVDDVADPGLSDITLSSQELQEIGVTSEAATDDVMEDIDDIAEEAVSDLVALSGARKGKGFRDCGTRTIEEDSINNITTVTIEFDGTCASPRGNRVRKGKIIIVRQGKRNEPGAKHTLTFEDFFVDSVQVEGLRTYENLSSVDDINIRTITATLAGGKFSFPDGTFATREATTTRMSDKSAETVTVTVTGSASGVSREGADYAAEITTALVFNKTCEDVFIPIQGVKEITRDGVEIIKNYGDGTCDNIVTVTTDGVSEEVVVETRKRFPKAKKVFKKRRG